MPEEHYRKLVRQRRIEPSDLDAALRSELDATGEEPVIPGVSRFDLWRCLLDFGLNEARGPELAWLLSETEATARLRTDLPRKLRVALLGDTKTSDATAHEQAVLGRLWRACLNAVERSHLAPQTSAPAPIRHRDLVLSLHHIDIDDWIHPLIIRFTSAYLDQGLGHWPMPGRENGMHACFIHLYGHRLARWCSGWGRDLAPLIADERLARRSGAQSLAHSLTRLGVAETNMEAFLLAECLALRGWSGMVHQFESRPDRAPVTAIPARLMDFLAIRLLLTRAALARATRLRGVQLHCLTDLRTEWARTSAPHVPNPLDRAWPMFQVAQLSGLDEGFVGRLSDEEVTHLEAEIAGFDSVARRRVFHVAYERNLRRRVYDALVSHAPVEPPEQPAFQAIFCIDEREESFRRHLEEVEPRVETFGTAGFFGVAMYYQSDTDAHPRPLCPVSIEPRHYVTERRCDNAGLLTTLHDAGRKLTALVDKNLHWGSRSLSRGAVIMASIGALWFLPLILRVLFPWLRRVSPLTHGTVPARTRLQLEGPPKIGDRPSLSGFSVEEMAQIVRGQFEVLGIADRIAPLVFVIGHASTSLNNPQEAAHDCGACGGGRGGPNARAFAQMANDPRVRTLLRNRGLSIPDATWFIGGQLNTANNDLHLFDEDLVAAHLRSTLEEALVSFSEARRREAHERCRRFDSIASQPSTATALLHVQARAEDLAQPRPEYGHATNAMCVIGRRSRTRNLFLDRRAFLVSYDPTCDSTGHGLRQLLAAVVPVVVGISLEYYFGTIDPVGYGCGTKLPHNVTSLLGVMDGAQSDLRTGLPWQMLEIHEPVRLCVVVETPPETLLKVVAENAELATLIRNEWLFVACLQPDSNELFEINFGGARRYIASKLRLSASSSLGHYWGRSGHLGFASLNPPTQEPTAP